MAVTNDPTVAANIQRVGEVATGAIGAAHVFNKPIPSSLGHYRLSVRFALIAAQAANSRLFELRNTHATNLIIPTRLGVRWGSLSAHTALIEDSIDAVKVTGFSAVDTTNTVTPVGSIKRFGMAAFPGSALLRHVTVAGAAAGMTGGTLVEDAAPFGQAPLFLAQVAYAATDTLPRAFHYYDLLDDVNGTHPFVFQQNEGFILKNRVLLGAAAGSVVLVDLSYAEVTAF